MFSKILTILASVFSFLGNKPTHDQKQKEKQDEASKEFNDENKKDVPLRDDQLVDDLRDKL